MRQDQTLGRGARVFGTVCLGALSLVSLGWIIRDFTEAHAITDVWWMWTGLMARAESGLWASSALDPVLMIVYAVAAALVLRSSSAAGILAATGTLTVLLRVPSLWNLNAAWWQGIDDGLKTKALLSAITAVVLGFALVVTAVAGRRPIDDHAGHGGQEYGEYGGFGEPGEYGEYGEYGTAHGPVRGAVEQPPARPSPGGGVTAFLLLGAAAGALVAWEIHRWQRMGSEVYAQRFTGERSLLSLLAAPGGWISWTLAALALAAALSAAVRAAFARPLGLVTAGMLLGSGVLSLAAAVEQELFAHFGDLGTRLQLDLVTDAGYAAVGLMVLIVLARGVRSPLEDPYPPSAGPYGGPTGPPGPPGSPLPHGGPPGW